jgi:curved DNA-binding protein CbpA
MQLPDYYSILEVPMSASLEQIKQSYRRLVRLYHPDINKGSEDIRIKQLNEAYAVLSDPMKRTAYDIERLEKLRHCVMLETIRLQQKKARQEQQMTWRQGMIGFVRELKKGLRDG